MEKIFSHRGVDVHHSQKAAPFDNTPAEHGDGEHAHPAERGVHALHPMCGNKVQDKLGGTLSLTSWRIGHSYLN